MTLWRRYIQRIAADPAEPVLPWLAPRVYQAWPVAQGTVAGQVSSRRSVCERRQGSQTTGSFTPSANEQCSRWQGTACRQPGLRRASGAGLYTHAGLGSKRCFNSAASPRQNQAVASAADLDTLDEIPSRPQTSRTPHGSKAERSDIGEPIRGHILEKVWERYKVKPPRKHHELVQSILQRYERFLTQTLRRRQTETSRLHRDRLRTRLPANKICAPAKTHSHQLLPLPLRVTESDPDLDSQSKIHSGGLSDKWTAYVAKLNENLDLSGNVPGASSPPVLSRDAGIWYSLIKGSRDESFDWAKFSEAISQSVNDRRRSQLKKKLRLRTTQLDISGLAPVDRRFFYFLERTIWCDAQSELWPESQVDGGDDILMRTIWQEAALYAMIHHPLEVPSFVQRIETIPAAPGLIKPDALEYSIRWADSKNITDEKWWQNVASITAGLPLTPAVSGSCLTTTLHHQPAKNVVSCIAHWQQSNVEVPGNTLLHAIDILCENGMSGEAISLLKKNIASIAKTTTSSALQSVLATVLRNVSGLEDGLHISQDLVTTAMQEGIVPRLQLSNIIMLNAVEANDLDLAFDVYNTLKRNDIRPDKYTFSILAKACKFESVSERKVARVIDDALRSGELLNEPIVAGEILHALYRQHSHKRPNDAYRLLLDAYKQLFDPSILAKLELLGSRRGQRPAKPMQPTAATVGVVVNAYLTCGNPMPEQALMLYRRIVELSRQESNPMPLLLEGDYITNAFIAFFGANLATLTIALDILGSTQPPDSSCTGSLSMSKYDEMFQSDSDYRGLSLTTISIVQDVFAKHSHPSNPFLTVARRMLDHMLSKGLDIDPRTLMVMLRAYLRHGDAKEAQACLEQLADFHTWNDARSAPLRRMIADAQQKSEHTTDT